MALTLADVAEVMQGSAKLERELFRRAVESDPMFGVMWTLIWSPDRDDDESTEDA